MKSRRHTDRGFYIDRNFDIYKKYQEGESIEQLASEYELSPITIRKIIKAKGMPKNDASYQTNYLPDFDEIQTYCTVIPKYNPRIDG